MAGYCLREKDGWGKWSITRTIRKRWHKLTIKEDWEKKLIQEARKLVRHGWGEMRFLAKKEEGYTRIIINAGKGWMFKIKER